MKVKSSAGFICFYSPKTLVITVTHYSHFLKKILCLINTGELFTNI